MFLITATRNPIQNKVHDSRHQTKQIKLDSLYLTTVTDNFLSRYNELDEGFSVIESVIENLPGAEDLILTEIIFNKDENRLSIFKPTQSGRPMYYHITSNGDFYCSSHVSMLKKAGVIIEENTRALPELIVYDYVTPPATLFKNISSIPIGSTLFVKLMYGRCTIESEQQFNPFDKTSEIDASSGINEDFSQKVFSSLLHAIEVVITHKNGLCFLLSGGLDSSILFKLAKDHFGISDSYSTAYPFEDPDHDMEIEYATSAAEAFKSQHTLYRAQTEDYLYGFLESIAFAEQPLHHKQSVMFHLLFKNGVPPEKDVIISGQGADSIFGSSLNYNIQKWSNHKTTYRILSKYPIISLINVLSKLTGEGHGIIKRLNASRNIDRLISDPEHIIYTDVKYGNENWVCDYFNVSKQEISESQYRCIERFKDRSIHDIKSMLYFFSGMSLTQSIWTKIAEHNGKKFYCPFMNRNIIDIAYAIDWKTKVREQKHILREIARYLQIPDFIINRRKSGFGIDPHKWAYKGGIFDPLIPLAAKSFDKKVILGVQSSEPHNAATFWNIMNYAIWKRLHIDNEPLEKLNDELSHNLAVRKM